MPPRSIGNVVASTAATQPTFQTFGGATSGTYTSPAGCTYIIVELQGGGGGGGYAGSNSGGGGSGGSYLKVRYAAGVYSYNTGIAGLGSVSNGAAGSASTNCTFSTLVAPGGLGGSGSSGGLGGNSTANTTTGALKVILNIAGGPGGSQNVTAGSTSMGGLSYLGTVTPPWAAFSGHTVALTTPQGYGGGGFGACTPNYTAAGNGGESRIVVTEFY